MIIFRHFETLPKNVRTAESAIFLPVFCIKKTTLFLTKFEARPPGTRVFEKSHHCRQNVGDAEPFASRSYRYAKIRDAFFTLRCFRLFLTSAFFGSFLRPKMMPVPIKQALDSKPQNLKKTKFEKTVFQFSQDGILRKTTIPSRQTKNI